jgi:hypothetical protein
VDSRDESTSVPLRLAASSAPSSAPARRTGGGRAQSGGNAREAAALPPQQLESTSTFSVAFRDDESVGPWIEESLRITLSATVPAAAKKQARKGGVGAKRAAPAGAPVRKAIAAATLPLVDVLQSSSLCVRAMVPLYAAGKEIGFVGVEVRLVGGEGGGVYGETGAGAREGVSVRRGNQPMVSVENERGSVVAATSPPRPVGTPPRGDLPPPPPSLFLYTSVLHLSKLDLPSALSTTTDLPPALTRALQAVKLRVSCGLGVGRAKEERLEVTTGARPKLFSRSSIDCQ